VDPLFVAVKSTSFGFHARQKTAFLDHQSGWLAFEVVDLLSLPNVLAMPAGHQPSGRIFRASAPCGNCDDFHFDAVIEVFAESANCLGFLSTDNSSFRRKKIAPQRDLPFASGLERVLPSP
jgi:hypothetical protein